MIKIIILLFILLMLEGCSSLQTTSIIKIKSADIAIAIKGKGSPTVVFESGMGIDKETWSEVYKVVSKSNKVIAYDRAGLGESTFASNRRDPCIIAKELHETLVASYNKPPYILVGHSIGGLYQYVFAKLYPKEVVGILLVDAHLPEPWIHDNKIPFPKEYFIGKDKKEKPNLFERLYEIVERKYTTGGKENTNKYMCLRNIDIIKPIHCPVRILQAVENRNIPKSLLGWYKKYKKWYFQQWFHILGKEVPTREVSSGHSIQEESPEIIIDEIQELLNLVG